MATTKKALAMADELASELKQRQSALAITQSFDTDSNPLIKVGAGTAGAKGGLIKIMPIAVPYAKDILGLAAEVYTPHVVQIGVEANNAAGAAADVNTWVELMLLIGPVVLRGARVEIYQSANGTAPTAANTVDDSTKLVASFDPSAQYPMVSAQ